VADFDKVIPPGQEGKINMAVDGARVHGDFLKTATVRTNDPVKRSFTIGIAGSEIPFLNIVPEGTVVLAGGFGEAVTRQLIVTSNEKDLDFKVTQLGSNMDDKITYTYAPTGTPGEYAIDIYKNPDLPTLTTYGSLFVYTNSKRSPKSEIQINVMTRGTISVSPITLNFGAVRFGDREAAGTPVTKSVMLSKAAGAFAITGVDLNNANFAAVPEPVGDGNQYRVLVTFRPPMKRQTRHIESAEMIIHTNDSQEPAIRVAVVARAM
jgi:hypothetical protein